MVKPSTSEPALGFAMGISWDLMWKLWETMWFAISHDIPIVSIYHISTYNYDWIWRLSEYSGIYINGIWYARWDTYMMGCIMMPWDFEELNQWQLSFKQQQNVYSLGFSCIKLCPTMKKGDFMGCINRICIMASCWEYHGMVLHGIMGIPWENGDATSQTNCRLAR